MLALSFIHDFTFMEWKGEIFRQVSGTSMGSGAAPALACLYLSLLELTLLSPDGVFLRKDACDGYAPLFFCRYIDDAGGKWSGNRASLDMFIALLQELARPSISWTSVVSHVSINFLDITIAKGVDFEQSGIFEVSQYQKPANLYQYILPASGHLRQVFRNLIVGETIRLLRSSSVEATYALGLVAFKGRLLRRHYIEAEIDNVFSSSRTPKGPFLSSVARV